MLANALKFTPAGVALELAPEPYSRERRSAAGRYLREDLAHPVIARAEQHACKRDGHRSGRGVRVPPGDFRQFCEASLRQRRRQWYGIGLGCCEALRSGSRWARSGSKKTGSGEASSFCR